MAYKIALTPKEHSELLERKKKEKNAKILKRLLCIDMKNKGMNNKEIAEYCNVCIDTITDWLSLFDQGSFSALCSLQYEGRRVSKLEQQKEAIRKKGEEENISSLKDLQQWIQEQYGIETCLSNLFYFCKKNSIFLTRKHD